MIPKYFCANFCANLKIIVKCITSSLKVGGTKSEKHWLDTIEIDASILYSGFNSVPTAWIQ
jgi:hypothetical protein